MEREMAAETREQRQIKVDARVADLRARADRRQAESNRLSDGANRDSAFWTQPAYGNAAGRAFARSRDRERSKIIKAGKLAAEATELRARADVMESRGAVMAGDAAAERVAKIEATEIAAGQFVDTTFYGVRKVLKVNKVSVLVEGAFGPLKVEKQFLRAA